MKFLQIKVRVWSRLACVAISALALWLILSQIQLSILWDVIQRLDPWWLVAGFACFGVSVALASWRWHLMLRLVGADVHSGATGRSVLVGHFFNTLLLGPAGGDFAKAVLYSRWFSHSVPVVLASSFLDRILGGGGNLLFAALGFGLAAWSGFFAESPELRLSDQHVGWGIAIGGLLLIGLVVARIRLKKESPIIRTLDAFIAGGTQLMRAPKWAILGLLLSFLVQITFSGVLALCLESVIHEPLPWTRLIWAFPIISFLSGIPITVAGAGVREGAALVLLGLAGIDGPDAVAASLLVLITYLVWAVLAALYVWREERLFRSSPWSVAPTTITAVIPTFNEALALDETLTHVRQVPEITEVIVVDGGSSDETLAIARKRDCRIVESVRGRGAQMKAGAEQAAGDVVLLLHADTWLPPEAGKAVFNSLRDRTAIGGGFWKRFRDASVLMVGSRFRCWIRLHLFRRIAGDQVLFVRKSALPKIGGVPDWPLMEEFELCRRLRRAGRLVLAGAKVETSARRFREQGVLRTYVRMWYVTFRYYLGTSPSDLRDLYDKDSESRHRLQTGDL